MVVAAAASSRRPRRRPPAAGMAVAALVVRISLPTEARVDFLAVMRRQETRPIRAVAVAVADREAQAGKVLLLALLRERAAMGSPTP